MATTKWVLDPNHSELQFKVKHLMISNVTGNFKVIAAEVNSPDEQFNHANVSVTANISSIDTGNEQRDGHLKAVDFFDAEKFPYMQFVSKNYDAKTGVINGTLTIKDVSKPASFQVEFNGVSKDPWGNEKAG
ncbi:MAG TPA: YceI family protein, partial [Puia sp.]|nr:YceI family protein [Puia sp.]